MNYYDILEVDEQSSDEEIKKAYRTKALRYHPDTNAGNTAAEEMFKKINEAYSVLSDKQKRASYDMSLHGDPQTAFTGNQNPFTQNPFADGNTYEYDPFTYQFRWRTNTSYDRNNQSSHRSAFGSFVWGIVDLWLGLLSFRATAFFGLFAFIISLSLLVKGIRHLKTAFFLFLHDR